MKLKMFRWGDASKRGFGARGASVSVGIDHGDAKKQAAASIAPWFDSAFYISTYPDIAAAAVDPLWHYIDCGASEMRDPNQWFSTRFYAETNEVVLASGVNPLLHYIETGHREGRFPSALDLARIKKLGGLLPIIDGAVSDRLAAERRGEKSRRVKGFDDWAVSLVANSLDEDYYIVQLAQRGLKSSNFAEHYLLEGSRLGLDPSKDFSTRFYLAANPDVAQADINPFVHYLAEGRQEGRLGASGVADTVDHDFEGEIKLIATEFNADFYASVYPDVALSAALDHFVFTGWREGRDPNPRFSTSNYIEMYPDIRASGLNPFYHYLSAGRSEGRTPRQELGYRYGVIKKIRPIDRTVIDYRKNVTRVRQTAAARLDKLKGLLTRSNRTSCYITVSHDDFTRNFGGIQLVLMREAEAMSRVGRDHIHLFPSAPLPVVETVISDPKIGVLINSVFLGHFKAVDLIACFDSLKAENQLDCAFSIHSLLGHHVDGVIEIIQAAGGQRGWFWIHDYASVCAGFTLLRNDVEFCNAPPIDSTSCMICAYRPMRTEQVESHARVFNLLDLGVVAPSQSALDVWSSGVSYPVREKRVHRHATLVPDKAKIKRPTRRPGPLRIAFLGLPSIHKGWGAFRDLALSFEGDERYEFHHLGKNPQGGLPIKFTQVTVNMDDPDCMTRTVNELDIDVAIIWALWPETFCITAYEAISGGAAIVTYMGSGNVSAIVKQTGIGSVLNNEAELAEIFSSGEIERLVDRRSKFKLKMVFGAMTADLINERVL